MDYKVPIILLILVEKEQIIPGTLTPTIPTIYTIYSINSFQLLTNNRKSPNFKNVFSKQFLTLNMLNM